MIHKFDLTVELHHPGMSVELLEEWQNEIIDAIQESAYCSFIGEMEEVI